METGTAIVISVGIVAIAATITTCYFFSQVRRTTVKAGEIIERPAADVGDGVKKVLYSIAERIGEKTDKINRLQIENQELASKIERLERQAVQVNSIENVFQMGLISLGMSYTDFDKRKIAVLPSSVGRNEETEYLGVVKREYKQTLGIDMNRLTFQIDDSRVRVKGLRDVVVIGVKDVTTTPLLVEKRVFLTGSRLLPDSVEIRPADETEFTKQIGFLDNRMNHAGVAEHFSNAIGNIALQFLRTVFSDAYHIQADETLADGLSFRAFIEKVNERRNVQKQTWSSALIENDQQIKGLEAEIKFEVLNGSDKITGAVATAGE